MWSIPNNHKFGVVAVQNCDVTITNGAVFRNGTVVLTSIGDWIDEERRHWLGEARTKKLEECNFIVLRHAESHQPAAVDAEHRALSREANTVFNLLAYQGVASYESAWSIRGSFIAPIRDMRQMGQLPRFFRTEGTPSATITDDRIRLADTALPHWLEVTASTDFRRFRLSLAVLLNGLREQSGEERIHQYARSLEGLILPTVGSTERQFVHRCQTFTGASDYNRTMLQDAFRMRSDTEHLHTWDRLFQNYPAHEREIVALRRLRQTERLAGFAMLRVLTTPSLREWFRDDTAIQRFWALKDHERAALWGTQLDIQSIA